MKILYRKITTITVIAVIAVIAAVWFADRLKRSELTVDINNQINITTEQIESIKAIGEWEFLSIACEEMVDTIRKGIFSDDHLVRIYYGTIRLGINMHHAERGWIRAEDDSITVTLPPIELLDSDFIDEAQTKSFYESGRWTGQDREALYARAHKQMLARGLTALNLQTARDNGEAQFRKMLQAMGYRRIAISWRRQ